MISAIIGGTGCQHIVGTGDARQVIETPYGNAVVFEKSLGAGSLYFLLRHGEGHNVPPHLVNYRANIAALKQLGVSQAIGIYAVGSITRKLAPGEVGLMDQFIDFTGGNRENTFYTGGSRGVRHVPMESPYSRKLRSALVQSAERQSLALSLGGTYICTNGPRLETSAEIAMFRQWGADYVGMTGATETILANEAGIDFAGIAYSINWGAGLDNSGLSFIDDQRIAQIVDRITRLAQDALAAGVTEE